MRKVTYEELVEAGVHFGHMVSKWNPAMRPFIFAKKNGIHLIDLLKTQRLLERAQEFVKGIARQGGQIMYIGTKKQAKEILRRCALEVNMPYMVERWLGGTLTNFVTIRKSIAKLEEIEAMEREGIVNLMRKKERLLLARKKEKLEQVLEGIRYMKTLPKAVYIVDIVEEAIALHEALLLNIPVVAIVDTNADPTLVTYPIPGNDDTIQSIELITTAITDAIREGQEEAREQTELVADSYQDEQR